MRIFNRKGMLVIPNPQKKVEPEPEKKKVLLFKECYCQKGHNLICNRVNFNGFDGIYLKARKEDTEGFIGLSPLYGEQCRISSGIELIKHEKIELLCPVCDIQFPVFTRCHCGAEIITLFLNPDGDYADCIGICNRVGCGNSVVRNRGEMISDEAINSSGKRSGIYHTFPEFDEDRFKLI